MFIIVTIHYLTFILERTIMKRITKILKRKFTMATTFILVFSSFSIQLSAKINQDENIDTDSFNDYIFTDSYVPIENEEEFVNYWREKEAKDNTNINSQNSIMATSGLPSNVNLSTSVYFPNIGNQGQIGSCTAFSAVYYQYSYEANKLNNISSKVQANCYSPKWAYYACNSSGTNKGVSYDNVTHFLEDHGALRWNDNPYLTTFEPSMPLPTDVNKMRDAMTTRLYSCTQIIINGTGTTITSPSSSVLTTAKNLLANGKVLITDSYFNFNYADVNGDRFIYRCNVSESGHMFVVVGYDDNVSYDVNNNGVIEPAEKGAFIIANSWGTGYGNNGLAYVMYDALNKESAISGDWEDQINAEGKVRNVAFRYSRSTSNHLYAMTVKNYELDFIAQIDFANTKRNALNIDLFKKNIGATESNTYVTGCNSIGSNLISNFTLLFDYGTIEDDIAVDISGNTWGVRLKNYDSSYINIENISLIDNLGATIKNLNVSSIINNNLEKTCSLNLILGDLNYSESLNSLDLTRLQNYIAGTITFSSVQEFLADVNGDGTINSKDITRLMKLLAE